MPLTEAEHAALASILDTQRHLERWRLRAHQIEVPETGSELAKDNLVFPYFPISELARISLVVSGENLRLALDAIRARQLYPSAHFTVIRGALVGASQAVWILGPAKSEERRERGLVMLAEMYTELDKYYGSLRGLAEGNRERLGAQQAWLKERRDGVAAARGTRRQHNLTEMIGASADEVFSGEEREAVRRMWREMSSDAHVLGWSLFQRSIFADPDRRTGLGEGRALGSPRHIAEAFLASFRILKRGWSLFDRRCEADIQ